MPLPNAENAFVDIRKLREYCLNADHRRGKHKARVFASVLGLTREDAETLRHALLDAAKNEAAKQTRTDEYGTRYVLDSDMHSPSGQATVRSVWIVRKDEAFPRLVSCYVL